MKIIRIGIDGFRCLLDFNLDFEPGLTVIVGENDRGKSSLIDCLKVITQNRPIEYDDMNYEKNELTIDIEIENFIYRKKFIKDNNSVQPIPLIVIPTEHYLSSVEAKLNNPEYDLALVENQEEIKQLAKLFGLAVRTNSNIPNLVTSIKDVIIEKRLAGNFEIDNVSFPQFNNIQLDGKQFENVSGFFKEIFLKERQGQIWTEKVNEKITIEEFVRNKIDSYSSDISSELHKKGIIEKMQLFISDLTDIKIEPIYETKDLNIDAKVKFLQGNSQEINIQKKGDGTKRRISMALLELKKEMSQRINGSTTYLLDEPDTHLHVKAQMDLLATLYDFCSQGHQVIMTTHSPFLVNAVKPEEVRLLYQREINCTKVRYIKKSTEIESSILRNIGIENSYLFFARKIILVEGETEDAYIPSFFENKTSKTINSRLIKILNVKGIRNIFGFAQAILQIHQKENIFIIYDNDATEDTLSLIESLEISDNNKLVLGDKEFEDCFSSEAIHSTWVSYLSDLDFTLPATTNWTVANIQARKDACQQDRSMKFSSELRTLAAGTKKMTKPLLGGLLGKYVSIEHTPNEIRSFLDKF
jgi:predicted ATP-dependent endonuclease of OLD family